MGFAGCLALVLLCLVVSLTAESVVGVQESETQNGGAHSESEKEVGGKRVDSAKEEVDRGHLIISPEVPGGADDREGKEGKETDSMSNSMGMLNLS